jgi:Fic family protein
VRQKSVKYVANRVAKVSHNRQNLPKSRFCDIIREKVSPNMPFSPKFTLSAPIVSSLTAIERTRGFLEAANLSPDWVSKMQARALLLEAHHTTHIEGTHLTLDQSEKLMAGEKIAGVDAEDSRELLNYKNAFDFVAEYVRSQGAITESLVREIHKRLVEGVRGNSALPGLYRTTQNYVANSKTKAIIYTPPAPYDVPQLMTELVEWLRNGSSISPVLIAGIAQFQLVHIHPFIDGNGRTSRLLSTLYLYRSGYDFKQLFTISEYYDRNRQDYYLAIQSVRENNMDMTGWLEYFSKALEIQMQEIQLKGTQAIQLDVLVLKHHLTDRQKLALEILTAKSGDFTIQNFEVLCPGVSRRSLQRDLADLVKKQLIIQEGEKRAIRYRPNL